MALKKKNSIKIFLISSIMLFVILNFFFNSFINKSENNNTNIEYTFSDELISYLQKEQKNYIYFLGMANLNGYLLNEQNWYFGNDAKYMALYYLYNDIDLSNLYIEVVLNQNQFQNLDNIELQNLQFSKKNILKNLDKIILSYSFNNQNISKVFYEKQDQIKFYLDTNVYKLINKIFSDKIETQENIIKFIKINQKFCETLNINNSLIEFPNNKLITDKFNEAMKLYIQSLDIFNSYCSKDNFNFEYDKINEANLKTIISKNNMIMKFNTISKSNYLTIFILSFFISITFGVFVLMVISKLRKTLLR